MSPLWTTAMGRPGLVGLGSFGRSGRREFASGEGKGRGGPEGPPRVQKGDMVAV
jgi:hypothetical protein